MPHRPNNPLTSLCFWRSRTFAAALIVVLALTATAPVGVVTAQEVDREQEGTAPPSQRGPDADPDFDPGGDTALPFDIGAPADDGDDGAVVDPEPVDDPDALGVPVDDAPDPLAVPDPAAGTEPVAPLDTNAPEPAPVPAPVPAPPPAPPAVDAPPPPVTEIPATAGPERRAARDKRAAARERAAARRDLAGGGTPDVAAVVLAVDPQQLAQAPAPPAPEPAAAAAPEPTKAIQGRRVHTVVDGDSLWKIAAALLGVRVDDPDAQDEIKAKASRIYQLNREQIGTNWSRLIPGMELRLH